MTPTTVDMNESFEINGFRAVTTCRMTSWELEREQERARRLLAELPSTAEVGTIHLHRMCSRIAVSVEKGDDPLDNGILVGNMDGWSVESIDPLGRRFSVRIRFVEEDTEE